MNKKTQDSPTFVQDDFGDNNNDMNESYDVSFSGGERNTSSRTKQRVKKYRSRSRLNPKGHDDPQMVENDVHLYFISSFAKWGAHF